MGLRSLGGGSSGGKELAYAERRTNFINTNSVPGNVAANRIDGLLINVTGTGRPVSIEFFGLARHTVANGRVATALITNGAYDNFGWGSVSVTVPSQAVGLYVPIRKVLTKGVDYTFEIGLYTSTAGTMTIEGSAVNPMWMAVTER